MIQMTLYIVSGGYDYQLNAIYLRLYDDEAGRVINWYDENFKAYCLTDADEDHDFKGQLSTQQVKKYDALHDENVVMTKIEFENPMDIKQTHELENFYENHMKFYQSYIYDNDVNMGMPHKIENGKLIKTINEEAEKRTEKLLEIFPENKDIVRELIRLCEYPVPNFKRVAVDIEVFNETKKKIPSPDVANLPVICVCLRTNDGKRICFLLLQEGKTLDKMPKVDEMYVFTDEKKLLSELFKFLKDFPFIITFNGDGFDLPYLKNRALRLGIANEDIPITKWNKSMSLSNSIHIDLYRFFFITAIKNYAFKGRYKNITLDAVSKALLGRGKIETEETFSKLSYEKLVNYCMNDADLTYELTAFNNHLTMNLMITIARISRLPIEHVSRRAVGRWIASFLFFLHRKLNYLIPRPEDIKILKGKTVTTAMIKGKQYEGAIVIKPKLGMYFKVMMVDFGSLYPSILKNYNIGYATINCGHEECKHNTVGKLPHWMCIKHKSLESIFIGSLRDLRLKWYKQEAKNKELEKNKRDWYSVVQETIKVFMNASYGVFATKGGFAFGCPPASEEIAAIARFIIQKTAEKAAEMGLTVLYGDTDSLFLHDPPADKIKLLQQWAIDTWGIDLELDKQYRYVCFSQRKKNYLGVLTNGDVDVKGMTGKKRHTPQIFKNYFNDLKDILVTINDEEDVEVAKRKIGELIKEMYGIIKRKRWSNLEELAFHMGVKKRVEDYKKTTPQHVKAVKQLQAQGYEFEAGSIISFVKTTNTEGVKPLSLAKDDDIDTNKYIEFMRGVFEQILDPLGISFDELIGIKKISSYF